MDRSEVTQPARFVFKVVNAPLERDLACDTFVLSPAIPSKEAEERLRGPNARWTITATGEYATQQRVPELQQRASSSFAREAFEEFSQRAEVLGLLFSLANRNHVQIVDPRLEVWRDRGWEQVGGHGFFPAYPGSAQLLSWHYAHDQLQRFLNHAYRRMVTELQEMRSMRQDRGLRLALLSLDQSRNDDLGEIKYLRAWSALEILVERSEFSGHILSPSEFAPVRRELERSIKNALPGADAEHRAMRKAMYEKVEELNRKGTVTSVCQFLEATLPPDTYPQHKVEAHEIQEFALVRNDIAHTGVLQQATLDRFGAMYPEPRYTFYLQDKRMSLMHLAETVMLAMLDWTEHPMDVTWREWLNR